MSCNIFVLKGERGAGRRRKLSLKSAVQGPRKERKNIASIQQPLYQQAAESRQSRQTAHSKGKPKAIQGWDAEEEDDPAWRGGGRRGREKKGGGREGVRGGREGGGEGLRKRKKRRLIVVRGERVGYRGGYGTHEFSLLFLIFTITRIICRALVHVWM